MLANKIMGATSAAPDLNYIEDVFSTYLYTGNGATQTITNGIDLAGEGGLVWIKDRTNAYNNCLFDTTQGATKVIWTNRNTPTQTNAVSLTAFNSDGFSLGTGNTSSPIGIQVNTNGDSFVSWAFREAPKFFDVVTYTGTGTGVAQNIAHSLGSVPGCIIAKNITSNGNWHVYHRSLGNGTVAYLNETYPPDTVNYWDNTTPTSTQFSVKAENNLVGDNYVAYLFAHDAGGFGLSGTENVISCGSFVAPTSGSSTTIDLGYEPQWILTKKATGTNGDWFIQDNMRGITDSNLTYLNPNNSNAEASPAANLSVLTATGFIVKSGFYSAGETIIYIAIRRGPMKVPTLGTSVFSPQFNVQNQTPMFISGFPVDFALDRYLTQGFGNSNKNWAQSRLTTSKKLLTSATDVEADNQDSYAYNNGWTKTAGQAGDSSGAYISWMFRRAPSFMDVVCDTGTGVAKTVSHNLSVAPELIIRKNRNGTPRNWTVACTYLPNGFSDYLLLSSDTNVGTNTTYWNATAPTTSVFSVGTNITNTASVNYVTYIFATCPGVSKVGTYTGTGTTQAIACGFTAGARFVMIKRVDNLSGWYVWDSARGIVAGNDPYLLLNTADIQVTNTDYIDTSAAGFEISSTAPAEINASGGSYIFLAVA